MAGKRKYFFGLAAAFCTLTMKAILFLFALVFVASAQQYCSPCEGLIGMIESYITENSTETQILQALESLCTLIPGSFGQQCMQAIADNGPQIIEDIINQESPSIVCTQLGLCTSKPKTMDAQEFERIRLRELRNRIQARKLAKKAPFDNCLICETVISYVSAWVASNQTEQYIENMITQYCPLLGLPVAQCTQIAAEVPSVIQQIENGASPQAVCQSLSLCNTRKLAPKPKKVSQGADCSICIFAVGQVEDYIASNATESEILDALNQACSLLGSFQAQCKSIVSNIPAYIAQLEKAEDPTTICTQVGLCTSKANAAAKPKKYFRFPAIKN